MKAALPERSGSAVLSLCGRYRYALSRPVGSGSRESLRCLWVMLNPSTASATVDDPTIRKCLGFARRWGCSHIDVANLFAWRATDPNELRRVDDPVGPENDRHLAMLLDATRFVVVAWGAFPHLRGRDREVARMLEKRGVAPMCLGTSASGAPRHPLMLAYTTSLQPWTPEVRRSPPVAPQPSVEPPNDDLWWADTNRGPG